MKWCVKNKGKTLWWTRASSRQGAINKYNGNGTKSWDPDRFGHAEAFGFSVGTVTEEEVAGIKEAIRQDEERQNNLYKDLWR